MTFTQIKDILFKLLKEINTDALGRVEIKVILGAPIIIAAVIYGIASKDWVGFAALFGGGTSLLTATTIADHKIDVAKAGKEPPYAT